MDGNLSSTGTVKIGPSGLAQLTGNLDGQETIENNVGLALPDGAKTTLKAGSTVDLALSQIQGAVDLPAAEGGSDAPTFVSGSATGSVGVHGTLGPTVASKDGLTVSAPGAAVNLTLDGTASAKPGSITGNGTVQGTTTLTGPATVSGTLADGAKVKTTVATGSTVSVDGTVSDGASGLAANGTVSTDATLGPTTLTKGNDTVYSPSGAVDLSVAGKLGAGNASGQVTGTATLGAGTTIVAPDVKTSLASPTTVSVNGTVSDGAGGVSASGTVKTTAALGGTSIQKNGLDLTAPSGTANLTLTGQTGAKGTSGQFTAGASLAGGTRVVDTKGPLGSTLSTTLESGTEIGAAGTFAGKNVQGGITGQVKADDFQGTLGPLSANIPADATVGVSAPFKATLGSNGNVATSSAQATVPIQVALHSGTTVTATIAGVTGSITLDTEGSYVEVVAHANIVNGKAQIQSLDNCTINIVLGDAAVAALGLKLGFPIDTRITVTGNASFQPKGLTASGTASIGKKGASSSWFQFNW